MENRALPTRVLFDNFAGEPHSLWKGFEYRRGSLHITKPEQAWRFRLLNLYDHLTKQEASWTIHVVARVGGMLLCASAERGDFPFEGHDNYVPESVFLLKGRERVEVREMMTDRLICEAEVEEGDIFVQPAYTTHKGDVIGEKCLLMVYEAMDAAIEH